MGVSIITFLVLRNVLLERREYKKFFFYEHVLIDREQLKKALSSRMIEAFSIEQTWKQRKPQCRRSYAIVLSHIMMH